MNKKTLGKGIICITQSSTVHIADRLVECGCCQTEELRSPAEILFQNFVRIACGMGTSGSTLGSIASAFLPVKTVDIGVPLLAMHSSRELMGTADQESLVRAVKAFYSLN